MQMLEDNPLLVQQQTIVIQEEAIFVIESI